MIIPVVMAGGAGIRLWPAARRTFPDPCVGAAGLPSALEQMLARVADRNRFAAPFVVTDAQTRLVAVEQARASTDDAEIVVASVRRASSREAAVAAHLGARRGPDAVVLLLGCDAGLAVTAETDAGWSRARDAAAAGRIVAFGTSGDLMARASVLLHEIAQFEPDLARAVAHAFAGATVGNGVLSVASMPAGDPPDRSFAASILARSACAEIVAAPARNPLGWDCVVATDQRDGRGNIQSGLTRLVDTKNVVVHGDPDIRTVVVGIEDAVVVTTPDAVLVTTRARAGDIEGIAAALEAEGDRRVVEHLRTVRPWGYDQSIDRGTRYQVKRIVVAPGGRLSLQTHWHRAEHWIVVRGTAEVTNGRSVSLVCENQHVYLAEGAVHRLVNPGKIPVVLIEVQIGTYLGEDDIVRLADDCDAKSSDMASDMA